MTDQQTLQGWITIGLSVFSGGIGFLVIFFKVIFKQVKDLINNNTHAMTALKDTVEHINEKLADHAIRLGNVETIHKIRGCSQYRDDEGD
jgi:predicted PurR-regulated permease PerM